MAQIAKVAALTGQVFVVGLDGVLRVLKEGDVVQQGEIIRTAAGGRVELLMADGQLVGIDSGHAVRLDESMVTSMDDTGTGQSNEAGAAAREAAVQSATIDNVIQALQSGGDLNQQLEATAAGAGGDGGGGGDSTFVRLLRVSEGVNPLAYDYALPTLPTLEVTASTPVVQTVTANPTITIDPVTGDNIVNNVEAQTPATNVTGTVGGNVQLGDSVTLLVNGHTYTGVVTQGTSGLVYSIPVSTADLLASTNTITATVTTIDTAGNPVTVTATETPVVDTLNALITIDPIAGDNIINNVEANQATTTITGSVGGDVQLGDAVTLEINGTFYPGTVVQGENGLAYSIVVNTSDLMASNHLVIATVSITNAAGSVASATANDTPVIGQLEASAVNMTVNEAALGGVDDTQVATSTVVGQSPSSVAETSSGHISITSNLTGDTIAGIAVATGGTSGVTVLPNGDFQGQYGVLHLNQDGSYTYSLTKPVSENPLSNNGPDTVVNVDAFTITVTDSVGSKADMVLNVSVKDDVPSISVGTVGTSDLGLTASDSDAGVPTHTADLSSVFASTFTDSPGADGASGSTSYALQITATPPEEGGWVDSGLLATAGGSPLHIYLQNVGGVVVGTTSTQALTAPAEGHSWSENSTVIFTLSNTGSSVTLVQYQAVVQPHHDSSAYSSDVVGLAAGTVGLVAVHTLTDGDGDTTSQSATLDLNDQYVNFTDVGPRAALATNPTTASAELDETGGLDTKEVLAANIAGLFAAPQFGQDGEGSVSYKLNATDGVATGLYLTSDPEHLHEIALVKISDTRYEGWSDGSTSTGTKAFTIVIEGSTGAVTVTQNAALDHPLGGAGNDNDPVGLTGAATVWVTQTVTDADGDTATAGTSATSALSITFLDDGPNASVDQSAVTSAQTTPVALVVDESAGNQADPADTVADRSSRAQFASLFESTTDGNLNLGSYGADGAASSNPVVYSLSLVNASTLALLTGIGSGLYALDPTDTRPATGLNNDGDGIGKGDQILLKMGTGPDAGVIIGYVGAVEYFRISADATSGAVTFTQAAGVNIWHADPGAANDSSVLTLGQISAGVDAAIRLTQTVTDGDGDQATAFVDLVSSNAAVDVAQFSVLDDAPQMLAKSNLVFSNETAALGATGVFDYDMGTDIPVHDLSIALTGTIGSNSPTSGTVTLLSETSLVSSYAFSLGTSVNGTLTFDKVDGTYNVVMTPQQVTYTTGGAGVVFQNYNESGVPDNSGPAFMSLATLSANHFYARFTGYSATNATAISSGTVDVDPSHYANGELLTGPGTSVTVSSTALGVSSNTIGKGEVLNIDFFEDSARTTQASADGIYLKFNGLSNGGIATQDLILVLKLVDSHGFETTKLLIAHTEDFYTQSNPATGTLYSGIALDSTDALLVLQSDDYNTALTNYQLVGVQIMSTANGITGSGIDFNGMVGVGTTDFNASITASDTDTDVLKITDMGFQVKQAIPDVDLQFAVTGTDADGDTFGTQTLAVNVAGGQVFEGTSLSDVLSGTTGNDTFSGGAGADVFRWTLNDVGSVDSPATDTVSDFATGSGGDALDLRDLLDLNAGDAGHGWAGTDQALAAALKGFVQMTDSASGLQLTIDTNGLSVTDVAGTTQGVVQTIALTGVHATSLGVSAADLALNGVLTATQVETVLKSMLDSGNIKHD
mgnify:CR=1 FL=1